jgi:hypothetical protein
MLDFEHWSLTIFLYHAYLDLHLDVCCLLQKDQNLPSSHLLIATESHFHEDSGHVLGAPFAHRVYLEVLWVM